MLPGRPGAAGVPAHGAVRPALRRARRVGSPGLRGRPDELDAVGRLPARPDVPAPLRRAHGPPRPPAVEHPADGRRPGSCSASPCWPRCGASPASCSATARRCSSSSRSPWRWSRCGSSCRSRCGAGARTRPARRRAARPRPRRVTGRAAGSGSVAARRTAAVGCGVGEPHGHAGSAAPFVPDSTVAAACSPRRPPRARAASCSATPRRPSSGSGPASRLVCSSSASSRATSRTARAGRSSVRPAPCCGRASRRPGWTATTSTPRTP